MGKYSFISLVIQIFKLGRQTSEMGNKHTPTITRKREVCI